MHGTVTRSAATSPLPDVDVLRQLFEYDSATGDLRWQYRDDQQRDWNERHAGQLVGHPDHLGRRRTSIDGKRVRVHRIIFKLVHGIEPGVIDHINGDPADNRIDNLRAATTQQNNQNRRSGGELLKGVSRRECGFGAAIKHEGNTIWLGTYNTEIEAHCAYRGAAIALFGAFARFE